MFVLDSLLIGSLRFVLDKVAAAANAEMYNESALREQLLEAHERLEAGEISGKEFAKIERALLGRIRDVKGQREKAISMRSGDDESRVEIELWDSE
jgi:hypothetical protein